MWKATAQKRHQRGRGPARLPGGHNWDPRGRDWRANHWAINRNTLPFPGSPPLRNQFNHKRQHLLNCRHSPICATTKCGTKLRGKRGGGGRALDSNLHKVIDPLKLLQLFESNISTNNILVKRKIHNWRSHA